MSIARLEIFQLMKRFDEMYPEAAGCSTRKKKKKSVKSQRSGGAGKNNSPIRGGVWLSFAAAAVYIF